MHRWNKINMSLLNLYVLDLLYELANDYYVIQHSVAESKLVDILRMSGSQKQVCQLCYIMSVLFESAHSLGKYLGH